jgi:hypothetical protein
LQKQQEGRQMADSHRHHLIWQSAIAAGASKQANTPSTLVGIVGMTGSSFFTAKKVIGSKYWPFLVKIVLKQTFGNLLLHRFFFFHGDDRVEEIVGIAN